MGLKLEKTLSPARRGLQPREIVEEEPQNCSVPALASLGLTFVHYNRLGLKGVLSCAAATLIALPAHACTAMKQSMRKRWAIGRNQRLSKSEGVA